MADNAATEASPAADAAAGTSPATTRRAGPSGWDDLEVEDAYDDGMAVDGPSCSPSPEKRWEGANIPKVHLSRKPTAKWSADELKAFKDYAVGAV